MRLSSGSRKADIVVVAARYDGGEGRLSQAQAYERSGAVWGDVVLLDREALLGKSPVVEGKSRNKHNKVKVTVEPLEPQLIAAILDGTVKEGRPKGREVWEKLGTRHGAR